MRHAISILMENESGALSRVAGLFSARAYNIESLSVAPTDDPTLSRLSLVTRGSEEVVEQIIKQLNKLIDVVKLMDLNEHPHIERELMLVKIEVDNDSRYFVKDIVDIFSARIIDVSPRAYTVELTASPSKLNSFLDAIKPAPIIEIVRSGSMGIARGDVALRI
ncbi:MAG TPA: acetolactate synthase small subunit [Gammaproteobacteria bacterium]|nr:acetolactate synthase small subunit [Gammaproteobacteria bacterium]